MIAYDENQAGDYFRKKYPVREKYLKYLFSGTRKKPTSVVIIEPPRIFILKYMRLLKLYDLPLPIAWSAEDNETESNDAEIL